MWLLLGVFFVFFFVIVDILLEKKLNVHKATEGMNIIIRILKKQCWYVFRLLYHILYYYIFPIIIWYILFILYHIFLCYIMHINYIIIYFQIIIFSDCCTDILFDYYYYLSNHLNVISDILKNLLNEQITLFYKSSSFKVVMYLSKGSQCTRICFGIVRNVNKSNWKWKIIQGSFGKSFSRFCFSTSRISNCRL